MAKTVEVKSGKFCNLKPMVRADVIVVTLRAADVDHAMIMASIAAEARGCFTVELHTQRVIRTSTSLSYEYTFHMVD